MTERGSDSCFVEHSGSVAEIVLNRPEQRNALDYATVSALTAALAEADADPGVRAILLRGEGSCFCSGGDLSEFQDGIGQSALTYHDAGDVWAELMDGLPRQRVPVIVAAHGYALAGATGIVAAADVVVAAEGTRFGLPEINVGLFPAIVFATVAAAVGPSAARELALTGRRIDTQEALRLGLVHHVAPLGDELARARDLAQTMTERGADVLRLGKQLMRGAAGRPVEDGTALGKAMRGAFMETDDFRAGVARFITKPSASGDAGPSR